MPAPSVGDPAEMAVAQHRQQIDFVIEIKSENVVAYGQLVLHIWREKDKGPDRDDGEGHALTSDCEMALQENDDTLG